MNGIRQQGFFAFLLDHGKCLQIHPSLNSSLQFIFHSCMTANQVFRNAFLLFNFLLIFILFCSNIERGRPSTSSLPGNSNSKGCTRPEPGGQNSTWVSRAGVEDSSMACCLPGCWLKRVRVETGIKHSEGAPTSNLTPVAGTSLPGMTVWPHREGPGVRALQRTGSLEEAQGHSQSM